MERVTFNISGGKVRRAKLHGREHIVAPMTLIQPGVLHGSQGSLFYPPTEVVKNYRAWDHVPLVVYHPISAGGHISARNPKVLEQQGVGVVLQTRIHNGALKAEGWFDVEKCRKVDNRVLTALESGKRMEISTGLYTNNIPAQNGAAYNGKPYSFVALNYRPDHLAILPDQKGACSLADGCGLNVNAASGKWITIRGTPVKIGAGGAIVGGPASLVKLSKDRGAKGGGAKPPPRPGKRPPKPPPRPEKKKSLKERLLGGGEKAAQQVFDEAKQALGEAKAKTVGKAKAKLSDLKGKAAGFAQKKLDAAQKTLDRAQGKSSPKPPPKPKPTAKKESPKPKEEPVTPKMVADIPGGKKAGEARKAKAQKEVDAAKKKIDSSKKQGPMMPNANLPKNPKRVNMGQAKEFLASKGMKMGAGRTDVASGKTSYWMTGGKAGGGMWLSAAKIKSLMYKAAGGGIA